MKIIDQLDDHFGEEIEVDPDSTKFISDYLNSCPSRNRQIWSRSRRAKNLTAGICLIFPGLNFSRNTDIGQIGHLWMGTNSNGAENSLAKRVVKIMQSLGTRVPMRITDTPYIREKHHTDSRFIIYCFNWCPRQESNLRPTD
jgi:hypothetical protein